MIFEAAHWLGIIPLGWLLLTRSRSPAHWWLAGAFGVSFLADLAAHWVNPWLVSLTYPLSQAAIIGTVFLHREEAWTFFGVLVAAALFATLLDTWPDLMLHTVAWLGIVAVVAPLKGVGALRTVFLVAFGLGWLCWIGYNLEPGWGFWLAYQSTRLAGALLFCRAVSHPSPRLALA